jgi:hypothetical protein
MKEVIKINKEFFELTKSKQIRYGISINDYINKPMLHRICIK